ncbi:hypothetical protein GCM10009530_48700 [Microbispora corallina]|uniref:Abortive infection protein n=1 Tax=Microbispora corallina TaxID=83302 RepID=A0ABQ4G5T5_9ACTN|nr:hypothetical protein [Microbispora corallina]GIH42446.1 hypothetical protein Mco01_54460 [Microbispora corallina]
MRVFGITYDVGFSTCGTTTHEPFDPGVVRREMRIIREDLRCDAVRITGADPDRLEIAARHAAAAGLEVWYSPFTNGLTSDELLALLAGAAERAERLRQEGASVVFLTGSEISLFTGGFIPGDTHVERLRELADPERRAVTLGEARARVNAFLARAVTEVRRRFGGPVGYASLPMEGVDWTPFDVIATDAGYYDATTGPGFRAGVRAQATQGKTFAVTEFGCAPYAGAGDRASRGDQIVDFDERARPVRLTETVVRDEDEQAGYLRRLLEIYDEEGVDAAFVYTFARRDLPTSSDPERDFDVAGYGVVKVLGQGRTGTAYPGLPWEPKAAFHALAEYGRARAARPLDTGHADAAR